MSRRRSSVPPPLIVVIRVTAATLMMWVAYTAAPAVMNFLADPRLLYGAFAVGVVVCLALGLRGLARARRRRSWDAPVSTLIFPPEPKAPAAGRAR
jgi:hypothetical protein